MDDWPELERIRVAWNAGVRARDWPVDSLPSLYKKVEGKWQAAYVHQVGYYSALDRGLFLQARLHIARAVQEATQWSWEDDEFVPHLLFERLYLFAYLQENFEDYLYCLEDFNYELDYAHTTRARAEAAVF